MKRVSINLCRNSRTCHRRALGMLHARNTLRCVVATMLLTLFARTTFGVAQDDQLPDAIDMADAWLAARDWVSAADLPAPNDPAASITIQNARGVHVIIRLSGRVVGSAGDHTGDDLMLRRAVGRAVSEAFGDNQIARLLAGVPREQRAQYRRELGRHFTMELEVAGPVKAIMARSFGAVMKRIEPGLDGVAMRKDDAWAFRFPSDLRSRNRETSIAPVRALAHELGLPLTEFDDLQSKFDVALYAFRTVHMTQTSASALPFETMRGDQLVRQASVDAAFIAQFADGIVRHLTRSKHTILVELGLLGAYVPVQDRYEPVLANPVSQALASYALLKYSRAPGVDPELAGEATRLAEEILTHLGDVQEGEPNPFADPSASAAIVCAILLLPPEQREPALLSRAEQTVLAFVNRAEARGDAGAGAGAGHDRAIIAAALAGLLGENRAGIDADLVERAIGDAWASVDAPMRISLLPWIAWAEHTYAEFTDRPMPHAAELRRLRDALWASQIGSPAMPGPRDLHGGIALTAGGRPIATAYASRPGAFLIWAANQPEFFDQADEAGQVNRVRSLMRFLVQLSVRESAGSALIAPGRAIGGVRQAVWDSRQPVAAQAMALMCAVEALGSAP